VSAAGDARRPRLFVSVGTDHHPFDRLVGWVADWARANPGWDVALQHGRTTAPAAAPNLEAFAFCDHARLQDLFSGSDAVVSHGGPATITEARRTGHRPVVVPRDPAHGEHVDGHQMLFAARLGDAGLVTLVASAAALDTAVRDAAQQRRATPAASSAGPAARAEVPPGVHRVGQVAEELVAAARSSRRARATLGRRR
jgi:UDP-N-acetylglucosamine transferase subunit ALG13